MRGAMLLVVAAVLGCGGKKKQSEGGGAASAGAPASTADQDALWALAPDGAQIGVVVSSRANTMIDHAWDDVRALISTAPEMALANEELKAFLTTQLGKPDARMTDLGLSPAKSGAFFVTPGGGGIAVVPLGDRDKLLALAHGTKGSDEDRLGDAVCRTVGNVYICASDAGQFAKIGKGTLRPGLDAIGTRGDIEIVTAVPTPVGEIKIAGVVQLAPGTMVLRAVASGLPPSALAMVSGMQTKPPGQIGSTAGFAMIDVRQMFAQVPPLPIIEGVTAADVARSIGGPLTLHVSPGALVPDVRIPLADPKPIQALIDHCDALHLPAMTAKAAAGACQISMTQTSAMTFEMWIEGGELRIGSKTEQPPAVTLPMGAIGEEMLGAPAALAFWGRGTLFSPWPVPLSQPPVVPDGFLIAVRAVMLLNEFGLSARVDGDKAKLVMIVRTPWANPDDVAAKILAITPRMLFDGKAQAPAKAVADAAPSSLFAGDLKAGAGLAAPMMVVGVLAAVAVPAFMDYMKKSKRSEPDLQLNKLGKNAKVYYAENAQFPAGDAPLTPAQSCCEQGGTCAPAGTAWLNAAWTALDFQIDEPTRWQYRYHSDGKTLDAEAIGDLDCDGTAVTYHLHMEAPNGNPTTRIEAPMPGAD